MEDNFNFLRKWKTTSIFREVEDNLNFLGSGRRPQFQDMEEYLNFSGYGRQPKFFRKWKTTKVFRKGNTTSIQYQLIPNISE
jgi:hypothetical protein